MWQWNWSHVQLLEKNLFFIIVPENFECLDQAGNYRVWCFQKFCDLCVWFPENINISIAAAILITGGDDTDKSAEVFLPWSNTTCQLPSLPDKRLGHVQAGQLLCGGAWDSSTWRSCLKWNKQTGGWDKLPLTLSEERRYSSLWDRGDQLGIMGGELPAEETSETVSSDGAVTSRSFPMHYKTRWGNDQLSCKTMKWNSLTTKKDF